MGEDGPLSSVDLPQFLDFVDDFNQHVMSVNGPNGNASEKVHPDVVPIAVGGICWALSERCYQQCAQCPCGTSKCSFEYCVSCTRECRFPCPGDDDMLIPGAP